MNKSLKVVWMCCSYHLRRWPSQPRVLILLLLIPGYLSMLERPVAQFCGHVGVSVSPWIFPFLTNDWYTLMLLMFGVILLFCDAPFIDDSQPYLLLRAGRAQWAAGQMLYILVGTSLYFGYVLLVSLMLLMPHVAFQSDWGKVLYTLSDTDACRQFQIPLLFSPDIIADYTPITALLISFFTALLAGLFLALVMMAMNLYTRRAFGITAAMLLTLMQAFAANVNLPFLYYLSPVSWAGLDSFRGDPESLQPTLTFCISTFLALLSLLGFLSLRAAERKDIEIDPFT